MRYEYLSWTPPLFELPCEANLTNYSFFLQLLQFVKCIDNLLIALSGNSALTSFFNTPYGSKSLIFKDLCGITGRVGRPDGRTHILDVMEGHNI
jgi:hypothetical protein